MNTVKQNKLHPKATDYGVNIMIEITECGYVSILCDHCNYEMEGKIYLIDKDINLFVCAKCEKDADWRGELWSDKKYLDYMDIDLTDLDNEPSNGEREFYYANKSLF